MRSTAPKKSRYSSVEVSLGLSPLPVIVEMKVYRDSLLKMVHNPGGDSYWEGGKPKVSQLMKCFKCDSHVFAEPVMLASTWDDVICNP